MKREHIFFVFLGAINTLLALQILMEARGDDVLLKGIQYYLGFLNVSKEKHLVSFLSIMIPGVFFLALPAIYSLRKKGGFKKLKLRSWMNSFLIAVFTTAIATTEFTDTLSTLIGLNTFGLCVFGYLLKIKTKTR